MPGCFRRQTRHANQGVSYISRVFQSPARELRGMPRVGRNISGTTDADLRDLLGDEDAYDYLHDLIEYVQTKSTRIMEGQHQINLFTVRSLCKIEGVLRGMVFQGMDVVRLGKISLCIYSLLLDFVCIAENYKDLPQADDPMDDELWESTGWFLRYMEEAMWKANVDVPKAPPLPKPLGQATEARSFPGSGTHTGVCDACHGIVLI